jgi:subtilisin family serine protease
VSPDFEVQAPYHPGQDTHMPGNYPGPAINWQIAPTGIQRVDASTNGKSQTLANNGAGVGVAVIDTGIQLDHPDLKPVTSGTNCISPAQPANDDNGHGTHVAGTIAARDNLFGVVGMAPQASLFAVKVLDSTGHGTWASVICGIDWVTANASANGIRVANMSLGGTGSVTRSYSNCGNSNSDALHTAICNSVKAGVAYVAAAGNNAVDAATFVPAGYAEVIAVSAWSDTNGAQDATGPTYTCAGWGLQTDETFATGTNWGLAVDIAAPGVGIYSTWKGSGYAFECGTSMASPHVAGAAALALAKWPALTTLTLRDKLLTTASGLPHNAQHAENLVDVSTY